MQKIAIPANEGILSVHFGHSQEFIIYDVEENKNIRSKSSLNPPPHEPGLLPRWLGEQDVTDVIAGGMGQRAIQIFNDNHINVYVGAPEEPADDLIRKFLDGNLVTRANLCHH